MKRLLSLIAMFCTFAAASGAMAAAIDDRVANLERQIGAMQATRNTNNQETASALARFDAMQAEFVTVKGQAEASQHLIRSGNAEMMKRMTELENRIQAIEDRMAIFSSQLTKALGTVAPQAAAEGELYQKGLDLASSSKYLEAAAAFQAFLNKYPQSTFAPSARFWIAECFYSTRDYQRAIKEFQAYLDKYPRDEKVAEAVFKQGNSFYELGMLEEAKVFFEKVISSYGRSSFASQAQDRLARIQKRQSGAAAPGGAPAGGEFGSYPSQTLEQRMQQQRATDVPPDLAPQPAAPQKGKAPASPADKLPRDF